MSEPISIVIPTLLDRELLAACLDALLEEVRARGEVDEVLVVDDSGTAELVEWAGASYPSVEVLARERNGGFTAALGDGVRAARHSLCLALNPDVRVRRGALDALAETLADESVHAASPYVLDGEGAPSEESLPELRWEEGFPVIRHAPIDVVPGEPHPVYPGGIPVAFALGGAFLFRRDEYLADPFDSLFAPFYWEDVDWGQRAIRRGRKVVVDPRAVVEHRHRGTIGGRVSERLVRAAIERNRLSFAWRHVEGEAPRREHLEALISRVMECGVCEEREELVWFLLAVEELESHGR